jgi:PAS domain S-box-containing protein
VLDRSGIVEQVNAVGLSLVGCTREQTLGKSFVDFVDREDRGHFSIHLYEVTKSAEASMCELTLVGKDGGQHLIELHSVPAMDSSGKRVTGCLSVVLDAGERGQRESRLRELFNESERRRQRDETDLNRSSAMLEQEIFNHGQTEAVLAQTSVLFEKVFATSYLAIACLDRGFKFQRVNSVYANTYGRKSGFFLDKCYFDLYPNEKLRGEFERVLATGNPHVAFAVPFVLRDGDTEKTTWWDWNVSTLVDRDGEPEGLLLCLVDVSERVNLERKIVEVTDQEQKRLGRELHDGMGQLLTAISVKTKIVEEIVSEKDLGLVPHVQEIAELVREATGNVRTLSKLLNPRIVETEGLEAALASLATETERRLRVSCTFAAKHPLETMEPVVSGHLYRIAQESVTNAVRHGQAINIHITVDLENKSQVLRIVNDGSPFDARKAERSDGLGVLGMRYRAESIGGIFSIEPGSGGGTVVTCTLPSPAVALDVGAGNNA